MLFTSFFINIFTIWCAVIDDLAEEVANVQRQKKYLQEHMSEHTHSLDLCLSPDSRLYCARDFTHLKLWHRWEDEHDDGGEEEEGADDHQHLGVGGAHWPNPWVGGTLKIFTYNVVATNDNKFTNF